LFAFRDVYVSKNIFYIVFTFCGIAIVPHIKWRLNPADENSAFVVVDDLGCLCSRM